MRTVSIIIFARIVHASSIPMEDSNIHKTRDAGPNDRYVVSRLFISSVDAFRVPIGPVDLVLVDHESKWVEENFFCEL